jgi:methylphosphotriester-DNA--protein-cysteine methyltransferase
MKKTDFYNSFFRAESQGWSDNVDTIASRCDMTRRKFLQLCAANDFDFKPLADRMRRKINDSLLSDPNICFHLIGTRLGFKRLSHYMTWHRKTYGISPLGLRLELTGFVSPDIQRVESDAAWEDLR